MEFKHPTRAWLKCCTCQWPNDDASFATITESIQNLGAVLLFGNLFYWSLVF